MKEISGNQSKEVEEGSDIEVEKPDKRDVP
jgi:hypothetical protein